MNNRVKKLIDEYSENLSPEISKKMESLISTYTYGLIKELELYGDRQYRRYLADKNNQDQGNWFLGKSEGADACVKILKEMLDEN